MAAIKSTLWAMLLCPLLLLSFGEANAQEYVRTRFFDEVVFYDGYLVKNNPDKDLFLEDGILRNYTYLYAVKMTPEQLDQFGDSIVMNVWVKACCDNYDRIGNINLALIEKGQAEYDPYEHMDTRIELGRFITPFMNKNKQPDTVPYTYRVDYLGYIFRDSELRDKYDFWLEFELFGVPYAANSQIDGCADRNDVFFGTLEFDSSLPVREETDKNILVPIAMKVPEYMSGNMNNYSENGTDVLGETVKTWTFEVPRNTEDSQIVLVTSNHGANEDGEEYNRRWHYVYIDDELALTYMPGRTSCEPFRKYNTQLNGIYGYFKRSDEEWQSFSNWCPGDAIDNRIIHLGAMAAGTHTIRISVPDAVFPEKQGYIPVSIFFQGLTEGNLPAGIDEVQTEAMVKIAYDGQLVTATSEESILSIELRDVQGRCLYSSESDAPVRMSGYPSGLYLLNVELANGIIATHKILK